LSLLKVEVEPQLEVGLQLNRVILSRIRDMIKWH